MHNVSVSHTCVVHTSCRWCSVTNTSGQKAVFEGSEFLDPLGKHRCSLFAACCDDHLCILCITHLATYTGTLSAHLNQFMTPGFTAWLGESGWPCSGGYQSGIEPQELSQVEELLEAASEMYNDMVHHQCTGDLHDDYGLGKQLPKFSVSTHIICIICIMIICIVIWINLTMMTVSFDRIKSDSTSKRSRCSVRVYSL